VSRSLGQSDEIKDHLPFVVQDIELACLKFPACHEVEPEDGTNSGSWRSRQVGSQIAESRGCFGSKDRQIVIDVMEVPEEGMSRLAFLRERLEEKIMQVA
jgi:hypothetical protein